MCPDRRSAVMITNISTDNLEGEHFCVVLDPAYLMYACRDPLSKTVLRYEFDQHLLTLNHTPISVTKLPDLIAKLSAAIQAVQDEKARIYSTPSSLSSKTTAQATHPLAPIPQFMGGRFA